MDEITILDKTYISSKRAAEITGYAKDYVGQLCREGHVDAKMVGRSWYVFEPSIRKHRFGEEAVVEAPTPIEEKLQVEATGTEPESPVWEPSVYKAEPVDMIPELETVVRAPIATPEPAYEPVTVAQTIPEDTHATLTDMQSAWREWFDRKQEVRIESPEVIDARNEVYEAPEEAFASSNVEADLPELLLPSAYEEDELLLAAPDAEETTAEAPNEDEFSIPIHKMQEKEETQYFVPIQRIAPIERPVETSRVQTYTASEPTIAAIREEKVVTRKSKRGRVVKQTKVGKRSVRTNAPVIAAFVAVAMISIAIAAVGTGYAERYLSGHVVNNPVVNFLVGDSHFKR
ncbi:MAG: hypothetical protein ABIT47_04600 [Candidatus Paceibacterota bacterium]